MPASAHSSEKTKYSRRRPGRPLPRSSSTGRWAAAGQRRTRSSQLLQTGTRAADTDGRAGSRPTRRTLMQSAPHADSGPPSMKCRLLSVETMNAA